jgi:cell division protease FtsH
VIVPLPDIRGREQILKVHMRKVPLADSVQTGVLARGTPGFSGADLANLVNEAALLAARSRLPEVGMPQFEQAKDKILMGVERRSMVMSEDERRNTAYHEAGHAIVGRLSPEHDPVYKVSIIPRGRALGVTMFLPEEDRYSKSRRAIISQVSSLFGGRVAEELVMGVEAVTTGASNDIKRATEIVRNMVTRWGLSELGPMAYDENEEEVFLGRVAAQPPRQVSNDTSRDIDQQVRRIIDECYGLAKKLLEDNLDVLHTMAKALMQHETLNGEQIDDLMARRPMREVEPPPAPPAWNAPRAAPDADADAVGDDRVSPGVPGPLRRDAD